MSTKKHRSEGSPGLGPFLRQLEERLKSLTPDQLREVLLRHARELTAKERKTFLSIFAERDEPVIEPVDDPELISDINTFIADLKKGDYCDEWGYDHEIGDERAFGDESWVSEMDDLFDRAAGIFLSGNRKLAAEAYGLLLHTFSLDEESGTFCGPEPPDFMVETNVDEAKARYFRSLYETIPEEVRVARLLLAVTTLRFSGSAQIGLRAIIESDDKPLQDLDIFLPEWLRALREERPDDHGWEKIFPWLLREAVVISEGTEGLAKLAKEEGDHHPEAYFDLVLALIKEGKEGEAIEAAKAGIGCIKDPVKRAMLADQLAALAIGQGDEELHLTARRQAWRADPTIKRLLLLCDTNDPDSDEICDRLKTEYKWHRESVAITDARLAAILQLLVGEYESPVTALTKAKVLGWSGHQHPGYVVFPFLLLSGGGIDKPKAGSVMADFFVELDFLQHGKLVLDLHGDVLQIPEGSRTLSDLLLLSLQQYPVTPEQRREFLKAAKSIALKRVRAIVSNKHRKAYERAARVLLGCVEALELAGRSKEGASLLEKVRNTFPRHSAFWGEVRALNRNGVALCD